jgi:hypothetical protein
MTAPLATLVYATKPGGSTLDCDDCGGNPFATALIELSRREDLPLPDLLSALRATTIKKSGWHQEPVWELPPTAAAWKFPLAPGSRDETRIALVLVVCDYSASLGSILVGAAHDERRIAAMLAGNGFTVIQGVPPGRDGVLRSLDSFARRSRDYDVAAIYATGHGVNWNSRTYLIPGDVPGRGVCTGPLVQEYGLAISRIVRACRARQDNIVFFAGCRIAVAN